MLVHSFIHKWSARSSLRYLPGRCWASPILSGRGNSGRIRAASSAATKALQHRSPSPRSPLAFPPYRRAALRPESPGRGLRRSASGAPPSAGPAAAGERRLPEAAARCGRSAGGRLRVGLGAACTCAVVVRVGRGTAAGGGWR